LYAPYFNLSANADKPQGLASLLLVLQVTSLALWVQFPITRVAIPAAALNLIGILALFCLTLYEHSRTVRPSTWICLYILASAVADSVLLRTLSNREYKSSIPIIGVVSSSIGTKICFLVIESTSKTPYLKDKDEYGPEEVTGVFGRSFLWWLNSLFWRGHHNILGLDDLYPIDHDLRATPLRSNMQDAWKKRSI
jgi:ATP-binding cassette subfamily C (CFTR/MRP) protein 1